MIRRRLGWMGAVAATACFSASVLFARQGVVKTRDGRTLEGDVEEKPDQVIVNLHGIRTAINRDNVDGPVQYFDNVEERYQAKVAALPKKPAAADRLAIARWAYDARAYDIAQREIDEARKLDPNSAEAATLEQTVQSQRRLDRTRPAGGGAGATPPAPRPAAGGNTPAPAAGGGGDRKLLSPDDINIIRRVEWRENDTTVPRATVPPNVRKRYVELKALDPGAFAALTLPQQAYYVLSDPAVPEDLKSQIKLTTDPQGIAAYRRTIQPLVLNNCATAGCHQAGGKHAGDFALFTNNPERDDVAYTNFYILQKYKHTFPQDDTRYSMVDRTYPDRSILAQFALSPDASELKHPALKGQTYKPIAPNRSAPGYLTIVGWMKDLQAGEPVYRIDYPVPGDDEKRPGAATPPAPDKGAPPAAATPGTPARAIPPATAVPPARNPAVPAPTK